MEKIVIGGELTMGVLARRVGLNVSAIRYYESVGLIPQAMRRASGHRVYGAEIEGVLTLIRQCRDFGFSVDETRELVSLSTNRERDCVEARSIAQLRLDAVRTKRAELQRLERSLSAFVQACSQTCAGGPAPDCSILKDISLGNAQNVARGCCAGAA
ncbi:MerR family DNA-binding protein [Polaromonas sp. A23]|uniref:MerR family DNA-binding protein n=1 Tax=Polaromonas sp. A23 TaxID=1944133 RepID=UPI0009852AA9|nr:MerR family DNA-binding protein [Polaromonas sp. A23]OOG45124.1 MerR family transcriptional regulator [Polaromonas sp. A23]